MVLYQQICFSELRTPPHTSLIHPSYIPHTSLIHPSYISHTSLIKHAPTITTNSTKSSHNLRPRNYCRQTRYWVEQFINFKHKLSIITEPKLSYSTPPSRQGCQIGRKLRKICPKWDKYMTFSYQFSASKCTENWFCWKLVLKSPRFVLFGAN